MKKIYIFLLLVLSLFLICFTFNNYFLYNNSIVKINSVNNNYLDDEIIIQDLTGIIKNGKYKGNIISFKNETSFSHVADDKYHKNTELLVKLSNDGESISEIVSVKRDKYVVILLVIFIDVTLLVGLFKGIKSLITLLVNISLSIGAMYLYLYKNFKVNILLIFIFLSILFIILSLLICNGKSKKTYAAIVSSILSTLISFLLSFIVIKVYDSSIYYWNMEFVDAISDYKNVFLINILLSGLGAIMDISITMASSINEIIEKSNNISNKALRKSGNEISKDIIGTMTNVMLYTCFISVIPVILVVLKNNMNLFTAFDMYGQIEMIRILTSCISIVLAIPISLNVCLFIYRGGKK